MSTHSAAVIEKIDCHFHIIDLRRFPLAKGMGYHPRSDESGTFAEMSETFKLHGVRAGLAVQPSGYGYDNRALLDAIEKSSGSLMGIGAAEPGCTLEELADLQEQGVVGLRFNLVDFDERGLAHTQAGRLLSMMNELGMFVDIQCSTDKLMEAAPLLLKSRAKILVDHCGRPDPSRGVGEKTFQGLLRLSDYSEMFIKLSGPFRESHEPFPHRDLDSFVHQIVDAFSVKRCVWGSDWPFINMGSKPRPVYEQTISWISGLLSEDQLKSVFMDTPTRLFGFKAGNSDGDQ
jgi:predicted TIM-barrel fold metal-dependent hydrolase